MAAAIREVMNMGSRVRPERGWASGPGDVRTLPPALELSGGLLAPSAMAVLGVEPGAGAPLALLILLSLSLLAYHHFGYPLILALAARLGRPAPVPLLLPEDRLPPITVVVPAYNEAAVIAMKLENLAALDYPADRLTVIVASDGSTDGTVQVAQLAAARLGGPRIQVRAFAINRGKIAVLNDVLAGLHEGIVCLTDASALLSRDALRIAAAHFADPGMGVVAATYRFAAEGTAGEAAYWRYQVMVKYRESLLGGVIGVHGAGYFYRADLFEPLAADTINDDFILPMRIVARGLRAVYETRIIATELEVVTLATDHRRRRRIAAGNMQQLLRLSSLLLPRHGAVAFCFLSGKSLRALSPFLMVAALAGSAWLASTGSTLFLWLLGLQLAGYALAVPKALAPERAWPKPLELAHYLVAGHLVALAGGCLFLLGLERGRWHRAVPPPEPALPRTDAPEVLTAGASFMAEVASNVSLHFGAAGTQALTGPDAAKPALAGDVGAAVTGAATRWADTSTTPGLRGGVGTAFNPPVRAGPNIVTFAQGGTPSGGTLGGVSTTNVVASVAARPLGHAGASNTVVVGTNRLDTDSSAAFTGPSDGEEGAD